ncbi:MAG: hypothetical protein K2Z81_15015 [Cyanobacteria bacterium]|nr:hypothetical protein [Cyanobacteriota bacterium]
MKKPLKLVGGIIAAAIVFFFVVPVALTVFTTAVLKLNMTDAQREADSKIDLKKELELKKAELLKERALKNQAISK